jgi:NAD(P)-dependent dehydrogenase (short-subunit alcohol dehydrogenase family)
LLAQRGADVVCADRLSEQAKETAAQIAAATGRRTSGCLVDVADFKSAHDFIECAISEFGKVDIWINNAGLSGESGKVWEVSAKAARVPITTNILGAMYGSQVAMRGMLSQGYGAIYNMEGMGSDGRKHDGLALYGMSKYAVHYFTESLALEARDTPVIIGALRPGMVITDVIVDRYENRPEEWERAKKIFNVIADRIENVTPWLAAKMLANRKNGVVLAYSSTLKLFWRFLSSPFTRRDLFTNG